MIKYICPICDKVMTGKHFCRSCRSWVKEPNVTKIDYYLNERHSRDEIDCEYHNDYMHPVSDESKKRTAAARKAADQKAQTDSWYDPKRPSANGSKPLDPMLEISQGMMNAGRKFNATMHRDFNTFGRMDRNAQGEKGSVGWMVIGIMFLISFFSSCS